MDRRGEYVLGCCPALIVAVAYGWHAEVERRGGQYINGLCCVKLFLYWGAMTQNDIKFHITESQFVLWFTISKKLLNANSDILFGCVYVPPENSVYSSKEAFEELENEMINLLKSKNRFISLIGDFNAKTSALPDFVIPDESVVDLFNLDTDCDIIDFLYDYVKLPQQGISLDRVTKCSCRPNNYGHKLLDLCKKNNLYIANSRTGLDKNIGAQTCKELSVIDYLILSSNFFPFVNDLHINDFVPLFSDCHNLIDFSLDVSLEKESEVNNTVDSNNVFFKWKSEKQNEYINYIHTDVNGDLANVSEKLDQIVEINASDVTKNQVNDFCQYSP